MTKVHRIKVFKDEKDNFGDIATATFDEGRKISDEKRMEIARQLNTGETVFVNDKKSRNISIVHPQVEVDFAGVAALAAAWLFSELEGKNIDLMTSRGGEIIVSQDSDMTWVRASLSTMPPWNHVEMRSAKEVEDTKLADTSDWQHVVAWA